VSDLLKTFREQGEPAPMYCAHMTGDGICELHTATEGCEDHVCHLGDLECEAVQEYVRNQPAPRSGT
jgi:hypothetical protein